MVISLPDTAIRCISYKNSYANDSWIIISTIVMVILMLGMHLLAALGRTILLDLRIPDQVIQTLMITVLSPFSTGFF